MLQVVTSMLHVRGDTRALPQDVRSRRTEIEVQPSGSMELPFSCPIASNRRVQDQEGNSSTKAQKALLFGGLSNCHLRDLQNFCL